MTTAEKIKGCGKEFDWDTNMPMICGEEYCGEVRLCDDCEGKMTTAEKFNLSERRKELGNYGFQDTESLGGGAKFYREEDVKEFIRLLKERLLEKSFRIENGLVIDTDKEIRRNMLNEIDKLAGDKLTK